MKVDIFDVVHIAVSGILVLVIVYNLYRAAVRKEINSFGLGWADKTSSPSLFVAYIFLNLFMLLVILAWTYDDYVRMFGPIPGFHPEPAVKAMSEWMRRLSGSK